MPYRDDQAALEARRDELRRDLADAIRHADALADALRDKKNLERELAAVEARLERARSRRLPLLENIRIAAPCSARWEDMKGDDRVRFCASCEKNVYNLSAMPGEEAERLIAEKNGTACVRLYKRADGTVLTADCPVGVRKRRVRRVVAGAVTGAGLMAGAWGLLFARMGKPVMVQGEFAVMQGEPSTVMGAPVPVMGSALPVQQPAPTAQPAPTVHPTPKIEPRHAVMGKIAPPHMLPRMGKPSPSFGD